MMDGMLMSRPGEMPRMTRGHGMLHWHCPVPRGEEATLSAAVQATLRDAQAHLLDEAAPLPRLRQWVERQDAAARSLSADSDMLYQSRRDTQALEAEIAEAEREGRLELQDPGFNTTIPVMLEGSALEDWLRLSRAKLERQRPGLDALERRCIAASAAYEAERSATIPRLAAEVASECGVTWLRMPEASDQQLPPFRMRVRISAGVPQGDSASLEWALEWPDRAELIRRPAPPLAA